MQQPGLRAPSREGWKRDIVRQLKHRDQNQHAMFTDLIRFYTQLLDKTSLAKGILSRSARHPSADSSSITTLLHRNNQLKKTTGEVRTHLSTSSVIQVHAPVLA
ncbi:Autophagy-related protein 16-2 APG16-like 2 [Collichthys lucidus]|uniref:Autophagy-related protein 16-2 APG16-like 2 n=1 Tax=Collichthys lucidus TaxID=240159 RepID=A0A4V6AMV5_COLLU|nr:Autophagy-related protein 16-2 APG16-like 2 [Collichthys lucidus]